MEEARSLAMARRRAGTIHGQHVADAGRRGWPALLTLAAAIALAPAANADSWTTGVHGRYPTACVDGTPHRETLVRVAQRTSVHVVDWGGSHNPRTMVLLTGLGDNAHVFDQFAFQFTNDFHVIGITRRGYLPSSRTGSGYDVATRARDDIAVLDALAIGRAVFVGHSVAGTELTALALNHPDRVEALVYLDAYDLSRRFQLPDVPPAPYVDADAASLQHLQAASQRLENVLRPTHSVCLGVTFGGDGRITGSTTPDRIPRAILQGVQEPQNPPVDWSQITVPRLGIFNMPSLQGRLPYYPYLTATDKAAFDAAWPAIVDWYAQRIDEFSTEHAGRPAPVAYALPDASHYFYQSDQAFVVLAMRQFLLGNPAH